MKYILSEKEVEESVLDEKEKTNVSGYVDANGTCSFNACDVASGYIKYVDGKAVRVGLKDEEEKKDKVKAIEKTTSKGNKYTEYKKLASARVSGDCCSLIGTAYHSKGGDVSNLRIHGDDVNVIIETIDGMTEISATFLGDDTYDVEELDDGADIFSFDEGDVVSGDEIRDPLIKLALEEK